MDDEKFPLLGNDFAKRMIAQLEKNISEAIGEGIAQELDRRLAPLLQEIADLKKRVAELESKRER